LRKVPNSEKKKLNTIFCHKIHALKKRLKHFKEILLGRFLTHFDKVLKALGQFITSFEDNFLQAFHLFDVQSCLQ
jgi:hypothetical protein